MKISWSIHNEKSSILEFYKNHFILEINLGKSRTRHPTTLKWKDELTQNRLKSRSMSDPNLSDIDFENKKTWVWSPDSGLPLTIRKRGSNDRLKPVIWRQIGQKTKPVKSTQVTFSKIGGVSLFIIFSIYFMT